MTNDQIKHMVDRFLGWRLPENFTPDAGISFERTYNEHTPYPMKHEPIGTNLFDAQQAEQMVRYMVEGMPCRPNPETQAADEYRLLRKHLQECAHLAYLIDMMDAEKRYDRIPELCKELRGLLGESLRGEFRSPVESVPVSALEKLMEELLKEGSSSIQGPCCSERRGETKIECADRLSAVIRGTKT